MPGSILQRRDVGKSDGGTARGFHKGKIAKDGELAADCFYRQSETVGDVASRHRQIKNTTAVLRHTYAVRHRRKKACEAFLSRFSTKGDRFLAAAREGYERTPEYLVCDTACVLGGCKEIGRTEREKFTPLQRNQRIGMSSPRWQRNQVAGKMKRHNLLSTARCPRDKLRSAARHEYDLVLFLMLQGGTTGIRNDVARK